ncbi:hypothetical protein MTQ01_12850 [Streptomyces sp. XM4193]|uniref:hypothetical protein n=1 Tax=Streptomyces sp. XM4193 TaxID=2929782 RepID=UPI001FF9FB56|nr:hypothetical protein [Streptomyces sp. XM4193]MCK1796888.1 hypothetical protein [Streptomyces sp. XM4193]
MRRQAARLLRPTSRTARGGSPQTAAVLRRCERSCAGYLADPGPGRGGTPAPLVAALGALLYALRPDVPEGPGGPEGPRTASPDAVPLDELLGAVAPALDADGAPERELALALTEAAVELRPRSKGAWRLRGRALEEAGRLSEAIVAHERYAALDGAEPRCLRRPQVLREQRELLDEATGLLPDVAQTAGGSGSGRAFAAAVAEGRPLPEVRDAFTAHLTTALAAHGAAHPDVARLAVLHGRHRRLLALDPAPDGHLADARLLGVHELRGRLEGRTVCVLAGETQPPAAAYDVVVRCDELPASVTGPIDVHATRTGSRRGWTTHAAVRIVLDESPRPGRWTEAIRSLAPGAQDLVGDAGLRRPLSDPALCDERQWGETPSTPFVVLRLLDFLDVSPRIELRTAAPPAETLRAPELDWLRARAQDCDRTRITLR